MGSFFGVIVVIVEVWNFLFCFYLGFIDVVDFGFEIYWLLRISCVLSVVLFDFNFDFDFYCEICDWVCMVGSYV